MEPWTDKSTQTKAVKALPALCAGGIFLVALILALFW